MIDVSGKAVTTRIAVAEGRLETRPDVIALVRADGLPKADVLATARIAGISGAKKTSELIPLCHPIPLSALTVSFDLAESSIAITASATTTAQTGVEMEALTAVAIAGLTLHDMIKAVDPAATLTEVRLREKSGGKHGDWTRGAAVETAVDPAPHPAPRAVRPATAAVIVASTRGASGEREDTTGPLLADWLQGLGIAVDAVTVTPDAGIGVVLVQALQTAPALIVTTGGTGVSPTDATPDATAPLLDAELPGIAEAIRARGTASAPAAALSRGLAGVAGGTVIVNLPGSPGGVRDGIAVLEPLLAHLLGQVSGGGAHD